jgi:hypothetical protein
MKRKHMKIVLVCIPFAMFYFFRHLDALKSGQIISLSYHMSLCWG